MDIKKTISSTTVHGQKDSAGRDFRTQLNIALDEVCSQAGFDVQKDPDGTIVTDGVTDFYSCGNCIYIREEEK